jgi:hypothetical protein
MVIDELIDNLVARLASEGAVLEPHDHENSISALEQRLPAPLPPSFRSLVTRYSFLAFEIASLELFGNADEEAHGDWAHHLFADKNLSPALLANGYIQFARPDTGSYDPICFDTRRKQGNGEYPLVWIDHESVLCRSKVIIRKELAPSFVQFVQAYLMPAQ